MKIESKQLIEDLMKRTNETIEHSKSFLKQNETSLNQKSDSKSWSALECFEHLNICNRFYLNEIEKQIQNSKFKNDRIFKSSWFGNYFANSMLPKDNQRKIKTFKKTNPLGSELDISVIEQFMHDQKRTLDLLEQSKNVSLNKLKTGTLITKLVRLQLGNAFRIIVYHNQRHLIQAQNAILK